MTYHLQIVPHYAISLKILFLIIYLIWYSYSESISSIIFFKIFSSCVSICICSFCFKIFLPFIIAAVVLIYFLASKKLNMQILNFSLTLILIVQAQTLINRILSDSLASTHLMLQLMPITINK